MKRMSRVFNPVAHPNPLILRNAIPWVVGFVHADQSADENRQELVCSTLKSLSSGGLRQSEMPNPIHVVGMARHMS